MIDYKPTNWENGKTVLKAEHLRKIEKGITDIISKNDAIYKDEDTRKSNEINRQNDENERKENEINRQNNEIERDNRVNEKLNEIKNEINKAIASGTQDLEVKEARDGEVTLKARLDRDIEKAKQVYVNVEGSHISTDSSVGYLKDVEILGNTIQDASNLADIRSVGDKVEGQELYEIPVLSRGKNLFNGSLQHGSVKIEDGTVVTNSDRVSTYFIPIKPNTSYSRNVINGVSNVWVCFYDENKTYLGQSLASVEKSFVTPANARYCIYSFQKINITDEDISYIKINAQLEEGTVATPYEPYQEDNLTILSPVQLEKVGDVRDRIIEKDGVWGVEKSVIASVDENNVLINTKIESEFIPLPHSQQIKLRTFAGKTNISFLTEIEGTIKAQVPKSLGATVNTHTEQINNLNKELDRVKKLEESTVSTVTTESDFTTVEATSNGYFEDVKLEGKTLVNLFRFKEFRVLNEVNLYAYSKDNGNDNITSNKTFTFINNTNKRIILDIQENGVWKRSVILDANKQTIVTTTITEYVTAIYGQNSKGWDANSDTHKQELKNSCILLEGDHTQNPPSYFEGLKSVGEDVDEVSVESVNKNLFNGVTSETDRRISISNGYTYEQPGYSVTDYIKIKPSTGYVVSTGETYYYSFYDKDKKYISGGGHSSGITSPQNAQYIRLDFKTVNINIVQIEKGGVATQYTPYQSDKKRLLFYNEETQTWEKPILREWDSIEKHSDGKYYYHQRSGEVVLNGSENWIITSSQNGSDTTLFDFDFLSKNESEVLCDKFVYCDNWNPTSNEGIKLTGQRCYIRVNTSKLSTQDVTGFKQWLQANNVTVVYQLAEEKVYECTNIDLITYANETNYIVESGAISPKTILKVHNNISNVVSLLQKKVSILESNMTNYIITQNRLMLTSRYNADTVGFKVDVATLRNSFEYDNDLYELILNNILVGKDNYDREYIENLIIFYWMDFVISDEMHSTLFKIIEEQHNPKVIEDEEAPL